MIRKIILPFFFVLLPALGLQADDRYSMDFKAGYNTSNLSYSSFDSSFNSDGDFGNIKGYDLFGSFIVYDGLFFGNSNYLTINYNHVSGKSFIDTNSVQSIENEKTEFDFILSENYLTRYDDFYIGAGVSHLLWDMTSSSGQLEYETTSLKAGVGYTHFFKKTYGVGLKVDGSYSFYPKAYIPTNNGGPQYTLSNAYTYSIDIPFVIRFSSAFDLEIHNKYNYYNFGKTDVIGGTHFQSTHAKSFNSIVSLRMFFR